MKLFSFCLICGLCFFNRIEASERMPLSEPVNLGTEAPAPLLKMYALDARGRLDEMPVSVVLASCARAKIGAPVIKPVAVYVVNMTLATEQKSMQVDVLCGALAKASDVGGVFPLIDRQTVGGDCPFVRVVKEDGMSRNGFLSHAPIVPHPTWKDYP